MDIPIYGFQPTAILCGLLLLLGCWIPQLCAAQTITLAWDPDTAPDIAGYRLYSGIASGVYTKVTEVGNATTTAVSNLVAGTTYFFAVTAYNAAGLESAPSNQISYTVRSQAHRPLLSRRRRQRRVRFRSSSTGSLILRGIFNIQVA